MEALNQNSIKTWFYNYLSIAFDETTLHVEMSRIRLPGVGRGFINNEDQQLFQEVYDDDFSDNNENNSGMLICL